MRNLDNNQRTLNNGLFDTNNGGNAGFVSWFRGLLFRVFRNDGPRSNEHNNVRTNDRGRSVHAMDSRIDPIDLLPEAPIDQDSYKRIPHGYCLSRACKSASSKSCKADHGAGILREVGFGRSNICSVCGSYLYWVVKKRRIHDGKHYNERDNQESQHN